MTVASFISGLFLPENRQRFPRLFADPSLPQIAVLCRTAKQLAAIAQALDEIDVPFRRAQRSGFYDRVEIQAVETILKALADPGDSLALIGALRTPFIGLSDEDLLGFATGQGTDRFAEAVSMITRLRRRAAVLPISSVIDELVERCGFAASAREVGDEEAASSIGGLLALLRDGELKGVLDGSPSAAFRWLALQRDADRPDTPPRSGSPEAVELLTMHGAKGLEFPMVILPFLAPQTARGPRSGLVVGDLPLPDGRRVSALGLKLEVAEDGFRRRPTYLQQLLTESDQEAVAAEERRVFYVACTRAREYLVLSGGGASGLGSDVAPSRDAARASRSPRDWLAWFESMRGEDIPRISPWT